MNCLSQSEVLVEDKLFATLDTTVRQFVLPTGKKALISDTVGFIRKLPPNLIASFRTTLSEVKEADFILHVVDISNPFFREHIYIVEETLNSLEITNKPIILILNKIDNLTDRSELSYYENEFPDSVPVSAERGINISGLLTKMQNKIDESSLIKTLFIPYSDSKNLAKIYQLAEVMDKQDLDEGIEIKVRFRDEFKSYYENIFFEFEKK
jgi:GTP-binding protein HflX